MAIQIEIITQKPVTKTNKAGKPYQVLDIAYKNLSFQGKVEGRIIMSFGATAETFKALGTANQGDVFDIEIVKNDAGYNDWVSAKKSVAGATPAPASAPSRGTSSTTVPVKSTYETPEERAKKQIYIVRQSSLSSAIDLLSVGAKSAPKVDDVIATAQQFESFVFGENVPAQPEDPSPSFEDLEGDFPN